MTRDVTRDAEQDFVAGTKEGNKLQKEHGNRKPKSLPPPLEELAPRMTGGGEGLSRANLKDDEHPAASLSAVAGPVFQVTQATLLQHGGRGL
ncbi:unnamed protein product [Rangifer tarandus platyrhynchus]|uniref:Uncharacterized protein n=1 Tax=Rangifer tarandus platyrhynchus TaxID=3082113 RepID=A0AC60A286_RANTA